MKHKYYEVQRWHRAVCRRLTFFINYHYEESRHGWVREREDDLFQIRQAVKQARKLALGI